MRHDHRIDESNSRREPRCDERGNTCEHVCREKQCPERPGIDAEPQVKPVRGKTLDYEATAERIEREQSRQLQHDTMRSVDAREPREHRSIADLPVRRACFHRRGGGAEHQGERDAEERVQDDDGAIAVDGRP